MNKFKKGDTVFQKRFPPPNHYTFKVIDAAGSGIRIMNLETKNDHGWFEEDRFELIGPVRFSTIDTSRMDLKQLLDTWSYYDEKGLLIEE